jgi:polyferredoxin
MISEMRGLLFISCLLFAPVLSIGQDTSALNEFEEFTTDSTITLISPPANELPKKSHGSGDFYWTSAVLLFTIFAGIFVRYKATRSLRSLFLILSIIIFGFYRGGCPCSIQSFQNNILLITGNFIRWPSLILFGGVLIITYLFGRVYCGWICHLGALQEFIFKTSTFKLFQSERSQKVMRSIRVVALIILVSQLLITGTNLYKQIDPFVVLYNFYSDYFIGWILVAIVITSSFVLYRPFCKTICPVGLMLGWVSKVPGASVLGVNPNCNSCVLCNKNCLINAITHDNKISSLDNQECIRCGECLGNCRKDAFAFYRKNKQHNLKIECKPLHLIGADTK